jgi:molybdate transport system regulatory protein
MTTSEINIDAVLALRQGGRFLIGRERIKLLEAIAQHGSITKAAKATGFGYKTAWDAVNAINNLLPTPAFITKTGGQMGGGAEVTDEGRRLIETFHRLEERLANISKFIAERGIEGSEEELLWTVGIRVSARNIFQAEVVHIQKWPVDVEVSLRLSTAHIVSATVTNSATIELDLKPGRRVLVLIKAPFIRLVAPGEVVDSQRNWFVGDVIRRTDAERNSEVHLDIGHGKTLIAVVPRRSVEELAVKKGSKLGATFDANHVILAVS